LWNIFLDPQKISPAFSALPPSMPVVAHVHVRSTPINTSPLCKLKRGNLYSGSSLDVAEKILKSS
jgi:hypothetical protein